MKKGDQKYLDSKAYELFVYRYSTSGTSVYYWQLEKCEWSSQHLSTCCLWCDVWLLLTWQFRLFWKFLHLWVYFFFVTILQCPRTCQMFKRHWSSPYSCGNEKRSPSASCRYGYSYHTTWFAKGAWFTKSTSCQETSPQPRHGEKKELLFRRNIFIELNTTGWRWCFPMKAPLSASEEQVGESDDPQTSAAMTSGMTWELWHTRIRWWCGGLLVGHMRGEGCISNQRTLTWTVIMFDFFSLHIITFFC